MKIRLTAVARVACLAGAGLVATAWSSGQAQAPATYMYTLMVNMVGPPANSLWETVGADALSDQDWERVKQMAARLTESAAAVSAGGTSIEDAERARSGEWRNWAGKFTNAVSAAAHAVERKDQMAVVAANDTLLGVCEGCHTAFPPAAQ